MTPTNIETPEWMLAFRRKVWAFEIRFLENERDLFMQMALKRQERVTEAYKKAKEPTGDKE